MTLQIEEGKFYRTRNGDKVGPMRASGDVMYPWTGETDLVSGFSKTWRRDGLFHFSSDHHSYTQHDLVAEWVDEPVEEQIEQAAVDLRESFNQALYGDDPNRVTKRSVLETALQTVADRGVPYGGVEDNFNRIALLWSAHMENRFRASFDEWDHPPPMPKFDASDVAMMMALMKIARLEANPGHADSWVDVAGYAACGGEIGAKLTVDKPVG